MTRPIRFYSFVLGLGLALTFASGQAQNPHKLRLLLSEIQIGSSYTDQYCTLVFVDHRFHSEKTNRRRGQDTDRWTYEGELSETEWNTLVGIIDSKEFRDLKVQQSVRPLSYRMHTLTRSAYCATTSTRTWSSSTARALSPTNRRSSPCCNGGSRFAGDI